MNDAKMLTFELSPDGDKIEIHCNQEGLDFLLRTLHQLADSKSPLPRHNHLMTPSWAGNELTEEKQGESNTLLNKVTVRLWTRLS
jgi:hypothetical protein